MSIDAVGDFLTIIRNGLMASKSSVVAPHSRVKQAIAQILKEEGFIKDFAVATVNDSVKKQIKIYLKYVDGESVIHEICRVSKPGLRSYRSVNGIKPVIGGLGLSIVTTSRGIISNKQAKALGVGGGIICTVW